MEERRNCQLTIKPTVPSGIIKMIEIQNKINLLHYFILFLKISNISISLSIETDGKIIYKFAINARQILYTRIRNIIQRNISSSLYFFYIQILNNIISNCNISKLINFYTQNLNSNTNLIFIFQFSIILHSSMNLTFLHIGRFSSSFVRRSHKGSGSPL